MTPLEIYNNLRSYREYDFASRDAYYRSFGVKTGAEVRIFDMEEHLWILDGLDDDVNLRRFLAQNGRVYAIPCELPDGTIFAFTLKAVATKAFYKVIVDDKFPMFFGMGPEFMDFEWGDIICLSEGVKDALAVKTVWKYSLAYLTSQPDEKFWNFLLTLTNRVVIFGDNDFAGRKLFRNPEYGFCGKHLVGFKDPGNLWDRPDLSAKIQEGMRQVIRIYTGDEL